MPAFRDVIQAVETHRHTHAPQTTPPAVVAAASEAQKARKRGHHARRHDSLSSAGGLKGRRSLFADDTKLRSLTLAQHARPPRLWISEYSREGAARRGGRKNIDREQPSDVTPMTTSRKLDAATPRRLGLLQSALSGIRRGCCWHAQPGGLRSRGEGIVLLHKIQMVARRRSAQLIAERASRTSHTAPSSAAGRLSSNSGHPSPRSLPADARPPTSERLQRGSGNTQATPINTSAATNRRSRTRGAEVTRSTGTDSADGGQRYASRTRRRTAVRDDDDDGVSSTRFLETPSVPQQTTATSDAASGARQAKPKARSGEMALR